MSIDWLSVLQNFSGKFTSIIPHLAPSAVFEKTFTQEDAKVCPLTNIAFLSVQGPDSKKFLQGQLTCDLNQINEKHAGFSGHCTAKGRLIGIFYIIQLSAEQYYLALPVSQIQIVQASLKKYAIFSKVKIEIAEICSFGLVGKKTDFAKIDPIFANTEIKAFEKYDLEQATYINIPSSDLNFLRFIVLLPASESSVEHITHYWKNIHQLGFKNIGMVEWHKLNILALLPTVYPETTEKCLPHTLNLPKLGAVSFKKGCYTGQEIVARMEYLGNLKKTICYSEFNWPLGSMPVIGESLSENKPDHILLDYVPLEAEGSYLGLFVTDI